MHTSHSRVFFSACLLTLVTAAPAIQLTGCSVSGDIIPLPTGQTNLTIPPDTKPEFIVAGLGTQNYSCSTAGTYTSIGAVAVLFDASCVFDAFQSAGDEASISAALGPSPLVLGHHYFVNNPTPGGTGLSPTFDFRADSRKGDPNAFVITSRTGNIPSPVDPTHDVDWLELKAIDGQGSLAKFVFRIFTVGGQPPSSCTPGSAPITVPYAANYCTILFIQVLHFKLTTKLYRVF
ncbi:hypothetical protein JB92DRAFT_2768981 [Gautieria morchelliformis]|nr:hypothetical protein JB92DRAFT_2768981 [Gautieria morchelliformis]